MTSHDLLMPFLDYTFLMIYPEEAAVIMCAAALLQAEEVAPCALAHDVCLRIFICECSRPDAMHRMKVNEVVHVHNGGDTLHQVTQTLVAPLSLSLPH